MSTRYDESINEEVATRDAPFNPLERCDAEVYKNGTPIVVVASINKPVLEIWCRLLAANSGQRVDWSSYCGRSVVRALGDIDRVRCVAREMKPLLDAVYDRGCGVPWMEQ
jgi:hypothetical protein